jgi:hypothetical protein
LATLLRCLGPGRHPAGGDGVDGDSVPCGVDRGRAGEADHVGLGGGVTGIRAYRHHRAPTRLRPVLAAVGLVAEGEDRCLEAVLEAEFGEDAADVGLDGLLADRQVPGRSAGCCDRGRSTGVLRAGVHGADEVLVVGGGGEHDDGRAVRGVVQCGEYGVAVQ